MTTDYGSHHTHLRHVHRGGVPVGERRSVTAMPLVWLIRLYQWTISPILGPVCGYYPSCSAYGVTALERHGPVKGVLLTGWRVLRCNPWSSGGVDHVPPPGRWRPDPYTCPSSEVENSTTATIPVGASHPRQ